MLDLIRLARPRYLPNQSAASTSSDPAGGISLPGTIARQLGPKLEVEEEPAPELSVYSPMTCENAPLFPCSSALLY
jgi:hypothetical protein